MEISRRTIGLAACLAAVATLSLPVVASAAARDYSGWVRGDTTSYVDLTVRGQGETKRVKPFSFDNIPISAITPGACSSGRTGLFTFDGPYPVNDNNRFRIRETVGLYHGNSLVVRIRGELRRHGSKAVGTLRAILVRDSDGAHHCDTGLLDWTAWRL